MNAEDSTARRDHWDRVHGERAPDQVTWFQPVPRLSLELIDGLRLPNVARVIDVRFPAD